MFEINTFFLWFYYGLGGLGGWFIFLLIAFAAVIWLFYDSTKRRLPVLSWRLGVALTAILILPAVLYRFTVNEITDFATSPLGPFSEPIFYLGVLGGVLPVILGIGYYISYQGMVGCPQGHVYEAKLEKCPHRDHLPKVTNIVINRHEHESPKQDLDDEPTDPLPPPRRHVHAWLVTNNGKRDYQLFADETDIGRSLTNDIVLEDDRTVNRASAKIVEKNGHFRLYALTTRRYPRMNGRFVREPVLLEHDDEIEFGESTILRFINSR